MPWTIIVYMSTRRVRGHVVLNLERQVKILKKKKEKKNTRVQGQYLYFVGSSLYYTKNSSFEFSLFRLALCFYGSLHYNLLKFYSTVNELLAIFRLLVA